MRTGVNGNEVERSLVVTIEKNSRKTNLKMNVEVEVKLPTVCRLVEIEKE